MPIAHIDPTIPVQAPEPLALTSDPKKFAVYDGDTDPGYSLEAALQGNPWQIRAFYRQILGIADTPKELDVQLPAAFQHYEEIKDLVLLLQGKLNTSWDPARSIMAGSGESLMYSFLRINVNDYFVAESNIGRLGLFMVKEVFRATHEKMSISTFQFVQIMELTEDSPIYQHLKSKVSVVKVFSNARLIEGGQPILLENQVAELRNLRHEYKAMANDFWDNFFFQDRGSLFLPGQEEFIYDPFLTTFVFKLIDTTEVPDRQMLLFLSEDNDPIYKVKNIWTVLAKRGLETLRYARLRVKLVNPATFGHVAFSHSAYFANTNFTIYPDRVDKSIDTHGSQDWELMTSPGVRFQEGPCPVQKDFVPKPTKNAFGEEDPFDRFKLTIMGAEWRMFNPVMSGEDYILPSDFFREKPSCVFEIMLLDYIGRRPINMEQLLEAIKIYPELPRLEQFYYGPMLMVMIKETQRGAVA